MNRGIYPILSGALAQERQIQIFAHNVANVNTAGFKQDAALFRSWLTGARSSAVPASQHDLLALPGGSTERVFVSANDLMTQFEAGRHRMTNNPSDVAIEGEGFF